MQNYKCPLCGDENCFSDVKGSSSLRFKCRRYSREFDVSPSLLDYTSDASRMYLNLLFEDVLRRSEDETAIISYFAEPSYTMIEEEYGKNLNLCQIQYPNSFSSKVDRVIKNLFNVFPKYSDTFISSDVPGKALFPDNEKDEMMTRGFLDLLVDLGYLDFKNKYQYSISAKGWKHIEELTRKGENSQGFIAMSFSDNVAYILDCIKRTIIESGYNPMVIKEKEHNNQIVPEIFYEIDRSSFLVMDVTEPNLGAYYEAGYALGKGKQVIICCKSSAFSSIEKEVRPHFDIAQKSAVIWENEEDLKAKLKKRIEATV